MGYRIRLGRIPKSEKAKYDGKSLQEVNEMMGEDFAPYRPPEHQELYEIGKYVDYPGCRSPFYSFDVYKETEGEFDILSKEGLLKIIEAYHNDVFKFYDELYKKCEYVLKEDANEHNKEDFMGDFCSHLIRMRNEWKDNNFRVLPYRLTDPKEGKSYDGEVSGSWLKEYAIFNLAHIFRHFDWENDYLIYSGW